MRVHNWIEKWCYRWPVDRFLGGNGKKKFKLAHTHKYIYTYIYKNLSLISFPSTENALASPYLHISHGYADFRRNSWKMKRYNEAATSLCNDERHPNKYNNTSTALSLQRNWTAHSSQSLANERSQSYRRTYPTYSTTSTNHHPQQFSCCISAAQFSHHPKYCNSF